MADSVEDGTGLSDFIHGLVRERLEERALADRSAVDSIASDLDQMMTNYRYFRQYGKYPEE